MAAKRKPARKMPKKLVTLDFSEDGYEGFTCETWVDPPISFTRRMRDWATLDEKDGKEAEQIFFHLFPSWDFSDYDGNPIPHTTKGMESIQDGLTTAMWKRRAKAIQNGVMPDPLEESSSNTPSGLAEASKPLTA
jgi:hypothetical protein